MLRPMRLIPTAFLILLILWIVAGSTECDRNPRAGNEALRAKVNEAIDLYTSEEDGARELAKAQVRKIGDAAVPYLEENLKSKEGNWVGAMLALKDLDSERSLAVLVEVMQGETLESRHYGLSLLHRILVPENSGWSAHRAQSIPGLAPATLDYLRSLDRLHRQEKEMLCDLVAKLELREATATLRELLHDSDQKVRAAAVEALRVLADEDTPVKGSQKDSGHQTRTGPSGRTPRTTEAGSVNDPSDVSGSAS